MNIFERATRKKLRFDSIKGELTTEQLWDMPLTSTNGFSLDDMAIAINTSLGLISKGSFVKVDPDIRVTDDKLRLSILKHVIKSKLDDIAAAEQRAENAAKRSKLIDALGAKEDQELAGKSKKQLLKELEELA